MYELAGIVFGSIGVAFSLVSFALSLLSFRWSRKIRQADAFAKLYDELSSPDIGACMEEIGRWRKKVVYETGKEEAALTKSDIYKAYQTHLLLIEENTKNDPVEGARRRVKAWHIKCLLYRKAQDLSSAYYDALVTDDRLKLMLIVITMTRAQWRHVEPLAMECSDEVYFKTFERDAAAKGIKLPD